MKNLFKKAAIFACILALTIFMAVSAFAAAGDLNGDGAVNKDDAIYLLMHTFFETDYPITGNVDYNKDGDINKDDAIYLLMHTFFEEEYPLGECEHNFGEWAVVSEPSCTEEGEQARVCTKCNAEESQAIELLDHDYSKLSNTWLNEANHVEVVCSVCNESAGFTAEGGYNEETGYVQLFNCAPNFTFDVVCDKNEEYIRSNLIIVETMFAETEGELLDAFCDDYNLEKISHNTWRVTPVKNYIDRTSYSVSFGEGVSHAYLPGNGFDFRTGGEASNVVEYNEQILFLKKLEQDSPGYYPYTINFDEENARFTLTLSKQGVFTNDLIGKILCVGECTDMESALVLTSDEVDMGKIESITQSGGKTVVTLGPVGLEDIFDKLDVTLGDKDMIVVGELSQEERESYAAELLTNESVLSAINTVEIAVGEYAKAYGAKVDDINWEETYKNMVEALKLDCNEVDSDDPNVQKTLVTLGLDDFSIKFTVKNDHGVKISTITLNITLKEEIELTVDGNVYKNNILDYVNDKAAFWYDYGVKAEFHAEIGMKSTSTAKFKVTVDTSVSEETVYFIITPSTQKIHSANCIYAANNLANCYTLSEVKEMCGEDYANDQCKYCTPFASHKFFVINKESGVVHKGSCSHVDQMNEENIICAYIRPNVGDKIGTEYYKYCDQCHPEELPSKTFEEYLNGAFENANWKENFKDINNKVSDALEFNYSNPSKHTQKIKIWALELGIDIEPVISFDFEASVDFNYVDIAKKKIVFDMRYDPLIDNYTMFGGIFSVALTEEEKEEVKTTLDIIGKLDTEVGLGMTMSLGPAVVSEWLNINLYVEVGVYAELRGIIHIDFRNHNEDFMNGYVDLGIYAEAHFNYTFFGQSLKNPKVLFEKTRAPLFLFGNRYVYYGYRDYDLTVYLGNQNYMDLSNSTVTAHCYDLKPMVINNKEISFTPGENAGYSISVTFSDKDGNSINYLEVIDGVLYVLDNAPEEFKAYMTVTVTDTITQTIWEALEKGRHNALGVCYTLPELTVVIDSGENRNEVAFAEHGGHKYVLYDLSLNWHEAKAFCESLGGHLATITSVEEQFLIEQLISNGGKKQYWLGMDAFSDQWITGEPIEYTRWDYGEPNFLEREDGEYERYVQIYNEKNPVVYDSQKYHWNDIFYDNYRSGEQDFFSLEYVGFICEIEPQPKPDEYFTFTELGDGTYSVKAKDVNNMPAEVLIPSEYNGKAVTAIAPDAFLGCSSLTSVTIPVGITSIGGSAFSACTSLTSITIPEGVKSIGDYAFWQCFELASVTIPNSVTSIGDCAFLRCESLTSVKIPDRVTSIGISVFASCESLASVTIPDSVTSIGTDAFYRCNSLKNVYYTGTHNQWGSISFGKYNDPLTSATIHYNHGK